MNIETAPTTLYHTSSFLIKILLSGIFIFFIAPSKSMGQTPATKLDGFSINPKVGFYQPNSNNEGGIIGGVALNVFKNKFLYSADYYRFEELVLFKSPTEHFNQVGLMVGKQTNDGIFRLQYQAGLGLMWGLERTEIMVENSSGFLTTQFESKDFMAVGFTPKIGFKIIPFSFLSIGIDFQANVNLENTVFMSLISVEIGDVRN